MGNINRLIEELILRNKGIRRAEQYINTKREEYNQSIQAPINFIKNERKEISRLENSNIYFNLETYVRELAKLWQVPVNKLKVAMRFDSYQEKHNQEDLIKLCSASTMYTEQPRDMKVIVEYNGSRKTKQAVLEIDLTKELLDVVQRNGETLIANLKVKAEDAGNGLYYISFYCENYKDLVLSKSLKEFIEIKKSKDRNDTNIAMFKAVKKDNDIKINLSASI